MYFQMFIVWSGLFTCNFGQVQSDSAGVHVDGYQESRVPTYPFQQYIQVRKTYTVEHVPVYDHGSSSSLLNPQASASRSHHRGSSNDAHTASTNNANEHGNSGGDAGHYYQAPRLREEISDYKKQEVYEEKGYGDSDYDHHSYVEPTQRHHDYDNENREGYDASDRSVAASSRSSKSRHYNKRQPSSRTLHTPDGSSTKILEYVASNLHDSDAQQKGIYAARSHIYCPEVIDFDLSSKAMAMGKSGNRGAKPRLHGLGSKIQCLKNKYFGSEPLPKAIFAHPSESKVSSIEIPSFNNFFSMVQHNVNSMSSFQNSKVPI